MNKNIKYYLAAYNFTAFVFWALYIVYFIAHGLQINYNGMLLLTIAQGMALLEILHALLKWVKSPVVSTTAQVTSRILVLALIDYYVIAVLPSAPANMHHLPLVGIGIVIVSFAWSITELVRYSFYLLSLFNMQPHWLVWMRYSFFTGMYPLGVTGEWIIIIAALSFDAFNATVYSFIAGGLFFVYLYYFPVLYKYMWKQRKAKVL